MGFDPAGHPTGQTDGAANWAKFKVLFQAVNAFESAKDSKTDAAPEGKMGAITLKPIKVGGEGGLQPAEIHKLIALGLIVGGELHSNDEGRPLIQLGAAFARNEGLEKGIAGRKIVVLGDTEDDNSSEINLDDIALVDEAGFLNPAIATPRAVIPEEEADEKTEKADDEKKHGSGNLHTDTASAGFQKGRATQQSYSLRQSTIVRTVSAVAERSIEQDRKREAREKEAVEEHKAIKRKIEKRENINEEIHNKGIQKAAKGMADTISANIRGLVPPPKKSAGA